MTVNFIRAFIIFSFILFLKNGFAQSKDPIKLTLEIGSSSFYPRMLDSVIFTDEDKKPLLVLSKVPTNKGSINVSLISGFYLIKLKSKGFKFLNSDCVTVCSQCDNKVHLDCLKEDQLAFEKAWLEPTYESKKMSRDFKQALTEKEIKNLQQLHDFKISFFVLKNKSIVDIALDTKNISKNDRKAILNGLNNLKDWNSATANGKSPVDGIVSIYLSRLLNN
jgi:hypothetical protein